MVKNCITNGYRKIYVSRTFIFWLCLHFAIRWTSLHVIRPWIKKSNKKNMTCVFIHDTNFIKDKGQKCHPLTFRLVLWLRPVAKKKIGQDKLNNLQLYLIGCHCRELTPDNVLLISSWRSRCTPTHTVGHHCHSSMWCYTLTKQRPSKRADQYPLDKQNPRGGQAKRTQNDKRTTFT